MKRENGEDSSNHRRLALGWVRQRRLKDGATSIDATADTNALPHCITDIVRGFTN
jgi:hypothetical protein